MVTVRGKALGRKAPLFADFAVPLPPGWGPEEGATLRTVITRIVYDQVAAFQQRQADRRFVRALTARAIAAGAEAGKVAMGGDEEERAPADADQAVAAALQAFEDGLYLVAVDGQELRHLDAQVFLRPDSQITFVRLTLLAGG